MPNQVSTRGRRRPCLVEKSPTAMHSWVAGHNTLNRSETRPRLGDGWISHLTPFHFSTSVEILWLLGREKPTARQNFDVRQETSDRLLDTTRAGLGIGWVRHFEPRQTSASVRSPPTKPPTATQNL